MSKSTIAETVGVHLRNEVIEEIERRAAAIDKKKGTYAALVLEKWFADGCPPVTEADRLMQLAKAPKPPKRIANPKSIDPWNLDPGAAYLFDDDGLLEKIAPQLGIPDALFEVSSIAGRRDILMAYENHPTHWIILASATGLIKRNIGYALFIEAHPKIAVPRHEIESKIREHAARIGIETRSPLKLSQLPRTTP